MPHHILIAALLLTHFFEVGGLGGFELREDNSFELREGNGGIELRE